MAIRLSRLILLLVLGLSATSVHSRSNNQFGGTLRDSTTSCGSCHGSAGVVTTLIQGPAAVLPGQTVRFEIRVEGITNPAAEVGFNAAINVVASNQPSFSVVAGQPEAIADAGTQIAHSNTSFPLKLPSNGAASYPVDLTVPAGTGLGEVYTVYAVGNAGKNATQVGWNHATNFTLTIAPPVPSSLTANQATATASTIELAWSGSQGEHFRVLRKLGGYASGPNDPGAVLVYEGPLESAVAGGLQASTDYYFSAYGKAPTANVYSSSAATATARTADPGGLSYPVGGTVSGLAGSGLVLQNNGADDLPVSANGAFTFATLVANGSGYAVTVRTQPTNPAQWCEVSNAAGIVNGAAVTDVQVVCATVAIEVLPALLDFGDVQIGVSSPPGIVTIENTGAASFRITALTFSGPAASDFAVSSQNCTANPLPPAAVCAVEVMFTPSRGGIRQATLSMSLDRSPDPASVGLIGISEAVFGNGFESP